MSRLSIDGISKNFFQTRTEQKTDANQSNPFGVSFKGNVLTADVFEKKEQTNLIERAKNKSRMVASAAVGSMNNLGSAIGARFNSVIAFGNRMRENVSNAWQQANNIEIHFDFMNNFRELMSKEISFAGRTDSVQNLQKRPVGELEELLTAEIASI